MCAYHTDIAIDRGYPLVRTRLQQFAGYDLLHRQDNAIFTSNADAGTSILDCLDRIFDLQERVNFRRSRKHRIIKVTWKFLPSGENTEF